jgi:hypothetical protein
MNKLEKQLAKLKARQEENEYRIKEVQQTIGIFKVSEITIRLLSTCICVKRFIFFLGLHPWKAIRIIKSGSPFLVCALRTPFYVHFY